MLLLVLLRVPSGYSICESGLEITENLVFIWVSSLKKKNIGQLINNPTEIWDVIQDVYNCLSDLVYRDDHISKVAKKTQNRLVENWT